VDILSEFKSENLLQRVIDATAEKLAGSLVLRNDVGAAALDVIGNADTATKFKTAMKLTLTGAVTGEVNVAGDANVSMATAAANSVIVPAGVIVAYYHTAAPEGWFICDGNPLSEKQQTANPNLTILLKLWNNGAALLPDLRGYFIRGYSADIALDPNMGVSRGFASKQADAMRRIYGQAPSCDDSSTKQDKALFTVSDYGVAKDLINASKWFQYRVWFDSAGAYLWEYVDGMPVQNKTKRLGLYTDFENRPKNMALNYIIKGG
jgi:hypothetical protein